MFLFLLAPLAVADPSPEEASQPPVVVVAADNEAASLSPIARALNLRPQVEELSNGLLVVLHENHRSPTVTLTTLVRVGSADDPEGASGLAHLFEHLMFKGSPNAPGPEWGRLLEEAGAESKAWTERDWTLYQTSGPSSALERLLFLESDRLGWLAEAVKDESVAIELDVIANERAAREGDQSLFFSELHQHLWPTNHPYHRPVLGLEADRDALEIGRIVKLYEAYYRPSNAILVLTGSFNREETLEQIKAHYGLIERRGSRALRAYADRPRRGSDRVIEVPGVGEPVLAMGWNTPPWGHPDLPQLRLAAEVLRARSASLPEISYRSDPQVALRARRAGGELVVQLVSGSDSLEDLLEQFDQELRDLALFGPTPEELSRARMRWQARKIADLEGLDSIGLMLARCAAVHEDPNCMAPEMQAIEAISPQQVQAAIRTHLSRDRVILKRLPGLAPAPTESSEETAP